MSNKPKIYGYCPAGCKWETIHRDEFERSASVIACEKKNGLFWLEPNKTYRIRKTTEISSSYWGFKLKVQATVTNTADVINPTVVYDDDNLPDAKFREYLTVRLCGNGIYWAEDGSRATITEINGEILVEEFDKNGSTTKEVYGDVVLLANADECYLVNESAEIELIVNKQDLPAPTPNEQKKLEGAGYYALNVLYMGFWYPCGVFYYTPSGYQQSLPFGSSSVVTIAADGALTYHQISRTVNESGQIVESLNDYTSFVTFYTAKLS